MNEEEIGKLNEEEFEEEEEVEEKKQPVLSTADRILKDIEEAEDEILQDMEDIGSEFF